MQPLDQTSQLRNTSSPHFQYTYMEISARKVTLSGADVAVTERIGNQLAPASWTFLSKRRWQLVDQEIITRIMILNNRFHYSLPGVFLFSFLFISCSSCWTWKKSLEVVTRDYFLVFDRDVYKASSFAAQPNRGGVVRSHHASLPHCSKIQFLDDCTYLFSKLFNSNLIETRQLAIEKSYKILHSNIWPMQWLLWITDLFWMNVHQVLNNSMLNWGLWNYVTSLIIFFLEVQVQVDDHSKRVGEC